MKTLQFSDFSQIIDLTILLMSSHMVAAKVLSDMNKSKMDTFAQAKVQGIDLRILTVTFN